jgi:hypothetical protein
VAACRGQRLELPAGGHDTLHLAAAAVGGDRAAAFAVDGVPMTLAVHDWAEPLAQWDSRLVAGRLVHDPAAMAPAYEKAQPLAWVGTHRHGPGGANEAYALTHVYRYRIPLPPGARTVTLPDDPGVFVVAATAVRGEQPLAAGPAGGDRRTVVHVATGQRVFTDTLAVTLTSPTPGAVIRYTLDGNAPGEASPCYTGPVVLADSATLTARAFAPGYDSSFAAAATFTRSALRPADAPLAAAAGKPGVECSLYEGEWRKLPDFSTLTPVRTVTLPGVGLPPDRPETRFGMVCRGELAVARDGVYTLGLRSDDGSRLYLGGELLIDSDGTHDLEERCVEAALAAGRHAFRVEYFQWSYDAALELWLGGPGRRWSRLGVEPAQAAR